MEDYSTVIWIIVIVGAMLYNGVTQSRKQAKNQPTQADKHTEKEAWPYWDTESAEKTQPHTPQQPDMQMESAPYRPIATQDNVSPEFEMPGVNTTDFSPMTAQTKASPRFDMVSAETTDFSPMTAQTMPSPGFGTMTDEAPVFGPSNNQAAHKSTSATRKSITNDEISSKTEHNSDSMQEIINEITEDFDMRKAVIYSELLKPKFNDQ